jgi:hypothetical protein
VHEDALVDDVDASREGLRGFGSGLIPLAELDLDDLGPRPRSSAR